MGLLLSAAGSCRRNADTEKDAASSSGFDAGWTIPASSTPQQLQTSIYQT